MKKVWKILLLAAAVMILFAVPGESAQAKVSVKVKKVTVKSNYGKMVHVAVGKKVKVTPTVKVTPNKAANKKVTYTSSKKKIATVSSAGNVKGVKTGSCKITVKSKKNKKKKATIKVKVVKKVTKVKVTTQKPMMYVGESQTLKATVTPSSGSFKKVKWSTSNKNIATVTSAGVVKGVAGGTVTIKATSVEGSKKSGSAKITVLTADSINISSVQVLTGSAVRVTLDKTKSLAASDVVVQGKKYASGKYNRKYTVAKLRNYDNKTYDLTLSDDYRIKEDSFVQVSIASLPGNGVKSMETQAIFVKNGTPPEKQWIGLVGDKWNKTVDLSDYCYGAVTYTVTGSIPGVSHKVSDNQLIFSGKLTAITPTAVLTIQATDELGNKVSQTIRVHVGSDDAVVASAKGLTLLNGEKVQMLEFAEAAGGSGKYTFAASNMPVGMTMDKDGTISGSPSGVGDYTVQITAVDSGNQTRVGTDTAVIKVVDKRKVTGTVKDVAGKTVANARVVCRNVDDGNVYQAVTDKNGAYTAYVAEGSYDISAEFAGAGDYVYNIAVGAGGRQLNFSYEEYQVTLPLTSIEGADKLEMVENWRDEDGNVYEGINLLMLKPGNYNLEGLIHVYQKDNLLGDIKGITFVVMNDGTLATPVYLNYNKK